MSLPASNIDEVRGISRSTVFQLTIGEEYAVYGVTVRLGTPWYYIIDDDRLAWPVWNPSSLFDVVDGGIPASWKYGVFRFANGDEFSLLSFPEWTNDYYFYEKLLNGDPSAVALFAERRREVDRDLPR